MKALAVSAVALAALVNGSGGMHPPERYDHVHISAPEPAAAAEWYLANIGGQKLEQADRIAFGKTLIIFLKRQAEAAGSAGSAVDHIAFSVPDVAGRTRALEAGGVKVVTPLRSSAGIGEHSFLEDPWGTRIELLEDPEIAGFHHAHLSSPDPVAALAWYAETFGGELARYHDQVDGIRYGEFWLLARKSEAAVAPTAGRALDHLGWSLPDIDLATAAFKLRGIRFTQDPAPFRDPRIAIKIGFIEGPDGVKIEIVQRPEGWPPWEVAQQH